MKPYKATSLRNAERMVRNLRAQVAAREELLNRFDKERRLMARLASDKPEFYNPLEVAEATRLRDFLLGRSNIIVEPRG